MSPKSKINIGLIGLGSWAQQAYVPALSEMQDLVSVKAVAAKSQKTRDLAKNIFHKENILLFEGYEDLIKNSQVDTIMIGLPRKITTNATKLALEKNLNIFVEPPFEYENLSNEILTTASSYDKIFHVDIELRFLPIITKCHDLINSGKLGEILKTTVTLECDWFKDATDDVKKTNEFVKGLSTWYIDLIDLFSNHNPRRIKVLGKSENQTDQISFGNVLIEYSNNYIGEWNFNLNKTNVFNLKLNLSGSKGQIETNLIEGTYTFNNDQNSSSGIIKASSPTLGFVGMRESIKAFIESIQDRKQSLSNAISYNNIHILQHGISKSIETNQIITIN